MHICKQIYTYVLGYQACLLVAPITEHWQLRFFTWDISNVLSKSYRKMRTCYKVIEKLRQLGLFREEAEWENRPQQESEGQSQSEKWKCHLQAL